MTTSHTITEFRDYVANLEIKDLDIACELIMSHYKHFLNVPDEDEEAKYLAWSKYSMLIVKFGMMFVYFTDGVLAMRELFEEMEAQNGNRTEARKPS